MRIAVLGSGVIGVTSAWYLARAGHDVVVVDRQPGPARETSFANAGEVSPGYASPWAAPGVPLKALRWVFERDAPLVIRPSLDLAMLRWMWAMFRNCDARRYEVNKDRMVRLAQFSRGRLDALREATGISYDERRGGTLQLFHDRAQLDGVAKDIPALEANGIPFEILDPDGCVRREPGLKRASSTFAGGLLLPEDETGDCFKFTRALAELARREGVEFLFDRNIERIRVEGSGVAAVETDRGDVRADAYLVALGSHSSGLLASLGLSLPVYPVKGYSLTMRVKAPDRAPVSTVLDERYKVAITRLGDRIRVGGMAEICGFSHSLPPARRATLERSVGTLFPDAGTLDEATFWSGLRPMTPDGTPVLGATAVPNLFLNTGHGTLGWTMACGSAHVVADIISGRPPAIRTDDLTLGRYSA